MDKGETLYLFYYEAIRFPHTTAISDPYIVWCFYNEGFVSFFLAVRVLDGLL
jgi:hypothetical protein